MNLASIATITRKEFKDVLRDRRTLFFMMLLPMLAMPLVMIGFTKFIKQQAGEREARVLTVAIEPQQRELLRALALRWRDAHNIEFGIVMFKLFGGSDGQDIEAMYRRLAKAAVARESGAGSVVEGSLGALYKNWDQLTEDQQELLTDFGNINKFLDQIEWVGFDDLKTVGTLSGGVEIPGDLPGALSQERVALAIQEKEIQASLHVPLDLLERLEEDPLQAEIYVLYDRSINLSKEFYERFHGYIEALGRHEVDERLRMNNLRPAFIDPFDVQAADIATDSRMLQAVLGGVMPYMLFIFCFLGAFYPALDLTAGEKERFTLETLLLSPVSRMDIAAGKFLVTFIAAVTAAVLFTASMYLTFTQGILPEGATEQLNIQFEPLALALTASLLIPIAALIAAVVLGVALLGRSFKEAQNYVTPLQFLFIIPSGVAFLPDLETEIHLAFIPLVNVSMLMKELMKGNYLWDFYWITLGSLLLLTGLGLWGTSWLFRRESVLMRS